MTHRCQLRITTEDYRQLQRHLFPGDDDEHGAVLKAGLVQDADVVRLLVREVVPAIDGVDYVKGTVGYRALHPTFIHRHITRCRDERLVYLAVHNHGSDLDVEFSEVDFASHERGYPALLAIAKGMPVGALVFGQRSAQADLWMPDGSRLPLEYAVVVGETLQRLYPSPPGRPPAPAETFNRQVEMFGSVGQAQLANCTVGIIGLGGVGSLVAEYLARAGVGRLVLIDPDVIEESNLSRIVGAIRRDVTVDEAKVAIARRHISEVHPQPAIETIKDDFAKRSVALRLKGCDFLSHSPRTP